MKKTKTAVGPFEQVLPMTGLPLKGRLSDAQLPIIEQGGILFLGEKILGVGRFEDIKQEATTVIPIKGKQVCLPGMIDSHTHICFSGSRANDFALRNSGKTYLDIAAQGGGIWDTVTKTRQATSKTLVARIVARSKTHLEQGTTTLEVKSGYGLSVKEELKMLRAIQQANETVVQDLIATCLAAHIKPKDIVGSASQYLAEISEKLFPILIKEKLTNRIDAFVEESAFSETEIEPYLRKAKSMGFDITVHADQFTTMGSPIATMLGAVSADHLEASKANEIELLANSNTVAVALPGASIGLGCPFTPARKLLDAGACLAIASDHNPGSAPMGNLLAQAAILATFEKLTNAEVWAALTIRAAQALRLTDRGSLASGQLADFICFNTGNYQEITYRQGALAPTAVWKRGNRVV